MRDEANAKGDIRIAADLLRALHRNRQGDNPNLSRGQMYWDFQSNRVRIAEVEQ